MDDEHHGIRLLLGVARRRPPVPIVDTLDRGTVVGAALAALAKDVEEWEDVGGTGVPNGGQKQANIHDRQALATGMRRARWTTNHQRATKPPNSRVSEAALEARAVGGRLEGGRID